VCHVLWLPVIPLNRIWKLHAVSTGTYRFTLVESCVYFMWMKTVSRINTTDSHLRWECCDRKKCSLCSLWVRTCAVSLCTPFYPIIYFSVSSVLHVVMHLFLWVLLPVVLT
jgi:hypothetical protein